MSSKVTFLLFGKTGRNCDLSGEIWTLNDWYRQGFASKTKRPARVYNIHERFEENLKDYRRYSPDWKQRYNDSGAEIVTAESVEGLERQRCFNFERGVKEFRKGFFGGTFSYMFADAIWGKYDEITIIGMDLLGDEYRYQALYLKRNLVAARMCEIKVNLSNEERLGLDKIADFETADDVQLMYSERGFVAHVAVADCGIVVDEVKLWTQP